MEVDDLYQRLGEPQLRSLVAAFYRRIPADPLLGPMYPPHDFPAAEKRLADFLIYRLGGPQTYILERGHPRLRMRHMPFAITPAARDRWVELMTQALNETWPPSDDPEARATLLTFLTTTADHMVNRDS